MTNEQEIVWSVFGVYLNDLKAYSTKPDRPTFKRLEEVRDRAIKALEQQPCEDCISREQAVYVASGYCAPQNIADELRKLPSVQPQPKRGKWEVIRKEYEFMGGIVNEPQGCKCSNCGGIVKFKSDFCPNCGADMREVQGEQW